MKNKLEIKDLINVGIFSAIYLIFMYAVAMLGFIPVLFVAYPLILPIGTCIPFSLFLTKVKKFGMITLMGTILGFIFFLTGKTWISFALGTICGLCADLVMKAGNYSNFKHIAIASGIFNIWPMGGMMPMWVMRDSYFEYIRTSMNEDYTNTVLALTPNGMLPVIFIAAFITGIIGAFIGKAILKKHFIKAGIV